MTNHPEDTNPNQNPVLQEVLDVSMYPALAKQESWIFTKDTVKHALHAIMYFEYEAIEAAGLTPEQSLKILNAHVHKLMLDAEIESERQRNENLKAERLAEEARKLKIQREIKLLNELKGS